jgi:hypothetical protein
MSDWRNYISIKSSNSNPVQMQLSNKNDIAVLNTNMVLRYTQEVVKYNIKSLIAPNDSCNNARKEILKKLFKGIENLNTEQLNKRLINAPFLQTLFPGRINTHEPTIVTHNNMKIGVLNIQGKLESKLTDFHPYTNILINKYKCDIIIYTETQCGKNAECDIPGWSVLCHKKAHPSSNKQFAKKVGGVTVIYNNKIKNSISKTKINKKHSICWFTNYYKKH